VDIEGAAWVDVDTPAALAHAEKLLRRFGNSLRPMPSAADLDVPIAV
jgi:hypothetical protein